MAFYRKLEMTPTDKAILQGLARQVAVLALRPSEEKKRQLWTAHNDLQTEYPMVFIDPENGWQEIIPGDRLRTTGEIARDWEFYLLREIFWGESLRDDKVIDANFHVPYFYTDTGWGMPITKTGGEHGGAYKFVSPLEDYDRDFPKLHFPKIIIDDQKSLRLLEIGHDVFDGILSVTQQNQWWWSLGLTRRYIELRGFETFLCDFILEPEWIHRMMRFLTDGTTRQIESLQSQGLLSQNIDNTYVGSGGFGFTNAIPKKAPGTITTHDMWGFVESQETVSVSPQAYGEFIFPYHKELAAHFALNCYGCCEPYDDRFIYAKQLKNLRRVSCSPWSSRKTMRENLGKNYIASIKLSPTALAMSEMDESLVRLELREAIEGGVGCVPELIMKDNNTLGNNPRNAVRWVEIAREEIVRLHG